MRLAQVPKMLSVLRKDWAPLAFCVSFKVSIVASKIVYSVIGSVAFCHLVYSSFCTNGKEEKSMDKWGAGG